MTPREDTDALHRILNRQFYARDDIIFREGDPPHYAYIIRTGAVLIAKKTVEGMSLLTTLVPGQIFGELALIHDKPRSATAVAAEPTELLVITPEQFKVKIGKLDIFMRYLVDDMTDRIYDLSGRIDD